MIAPGGFDRPGGRKVIPALNDLVRRLSRRHDVTVVLTRQGEARRYPWAGAEVIRLGERAPRWPGWLTLHQWRRTLAVLQDVPRPDVLHGFWIGECGVLAALTGAWWGVPVVVSLGGGELVWVPEVEYGGRGRRRARMQVAVALRLADAVTAGSAYGARPLPPTTPLRIVPLGAEADRFEAPVERPQGPPWRLIHVASHNPVKNQEGIFEALVEVCRELPQVHLDLVGEDWLQGALERRAAQLGLGQAVRFHGWVDHRGLAALYRRAHLYLQGSWHESQGVAVCEAAAAGLPTVGTAVGLVAELAPRSAWALPRGNPQALARAILTLLRHSALRHGLGRTAQSWARDHGAEWTASTFEELYDELVSALPRSRLHRLRDLVSPTGLRSGG